MHDLRFMFTVPALASNEFFTAALGAEAAEEADLFLTSVWGEASLMNVVSRRQRLTSSTPNDLPPFGSPPPPPQQAA